MNKVGLELYDQIHSLEHVKLYLYWG